MIPNLYIGNGWKSPFPSILNCLFGVPGSSSISWRTHRKLCGFDLCFVTYPPWKRSTFFSPCESMIFRHSPVGGWWKIHWSLQLRGPKKWEGFWDHQEFPPKISSAKKRRIVEESGDGEPLYVDDIQSFVGAELSIADWLQPEISVTTKSPVQMCFDTLWLRKIWNKWPVSCSEIWW